MRSIVLVCGLLGVMGGSGCALLGAHMPGAGAAQPQTTSGSEESAKRDQESQAVLTKVMQQNLDQCGKQVEDAEKALSEALDKAGGGKPDPATGKPAPTLGDAVAKLRKEKVTITIQNVGTPENPILMVKDSLLEQGQKIAAAPRAEQMAFAKKMMAAQPFLTPVRDDVNAVNGAIGKSLMSTLSCQGYAKALTGQLGAMQNGGVEPTPELFGVYGKYLAASARSEAVIASSMGLVSAMQAGLAGKDPKAIDKLTVALKDATGKPIEVTEEQARAAYKLAGQGFVDACQKQYDEYIASHPQAKTGGPSPCSAEGSKAKGPPPAEASYDPNDPQADLLHHLVPSDGPIAAAGEGLSALSKGDYAGAFKSALKLVPKGSPVGAALSLVGGLFG
jgi:hypothetical protein